jgi:hypothetical protein
MSDIALCISGMPRFFPISMASWGRFIGKYKPDIYIHTWCHDWNQYEWISHHVNWGFNPTRYSITAPISVDENLFPDRKWPYTNVTNSISMWYGINSAYNLILDSGKAYNTIIRGRFDWWIDELNIIDFDGIVIPDDPDKEVLKFGYRGEETHGLNDAIAYGPSKWMEKYNATVDNILPLYSEEGVDYCPENFLRATLIKLQVPLFLQKMNQKLVRG